MGKRGRPAKDGRCPVWMLRRVTYVLFAYEQARNAGLKQLSAVTAAVQFVRRKAPWMSISETGVKRILAEWQSSRSESALLVANPDPDRDTLRLPEWRSGASILSVANPGPDRLPDGGTARILFTAYEGPRPIYPRANAASQHPSSKVKKTKSRVLA